VEEKLAKKRTPAVHALDHVELFVPDRRRAARWYSDALGLSIVVPFERWADDPRGPLMVSSDGGATMLALFEGEPERGRPAAGFRRVAYRADGEGFLSLLEHLSGLPVYDESGDSLSGLDPVDHDGSWSTYFCDPWGHRLEVTTYDYEMVRQRLKGDDG
jgi:catechol 2,3-dioxygenase-like lactoylglutathione lyase family enzyme